MISSSVEKELFEKGTVIISTRGVSMEPLLYERKTLAHVNKSASFQIFDVVLFKRKNGQLVMHRIIDEADDYYVICGDNLCQKEKVAKNMVLGKMERFYRNGKWHGIEEEKYKRYVHIWFRSYSEHCRIVFVYQKLHRINRWIRKALCNE